MIVLKCDTSEACCFSFSIFSSLSCCNSWNSWFFAIAILCFSFVRFFVWQRSKQNRTRKRTGASGILFRHGEDRWLTICRSSIPGRRGDRHSNMERIDSQYFVLVFDPMGQGRWIDNRHWENQHQTLCQLLIPGDGGLTVNMERIDGQHYVSCQSQGWGRGIDNQHGEDPHSTFHSPYK